MFSKTHKYPKVKICCIKSLQEAHLAMSFGANALGLVGHMPSGPGIIEDNTIRLIAEQIPPEIDTFLLTSENRVSKIIEHYQRVKTTTIQLVDKLIQGTHEELKQALPNVKIVQVLHVLNENTILEAIEIAPFVDALLLDSGNPNLSIKELGGTGRTHNWDLSKIIVETVDKPVFLAGGLNALNVQQAVKKVQPFGIDLCSGVRTNDNLDRNKLKDFFKKVISNENSTKV